MSHTVAPFWPRRSLRSSGLTSLRRRLSDVGPLPSCSGSAESTSRIMPAATVLLVSESIRMNAPVPRFFL